jgi:hypothetical protein
MNCAVVSFPARKVLFAATSVAVFALVTFANAQIKLVASSGKTQTTLITCGAGGTETLPQIRDAKTDLKVVGICYVNRTIDAGRTSLLWVFHNVNIVSGGHSIVVPRPDGITVTFVGEDVKIAGFRKLNYVVRHQKGTASRFFERSLAHSDASGGSLSDGAKQLSKIAVDAVADVRQVPGHENFTPPGYNTLKEISQYRLRSDSSR